MISLEMQEDCTCCMYNTIFEQPAKHILHNDNGYLFISGVACFLYSFYNIYHVIATACWFYIFYIFLCNTIFWTPLIHIFEHPSLTMQVTPQSTNGTARWTSSTSVTGTSGKARATSRRWSGETVKRSAWVKPSARTGHVLSSSVTTSLLETSWGGSGITSSPRNSGSRLFSIFF